MSNQSTSPLYFGLVITLILVFGCHRQVTSDLNKSSLLFTAPWSNSSFQETHAQIWHTADSLHFSFQVIDTSLVLVVQDNFHNGIGSSDRVELFFSVDTLMTQYYGMEIGYDNRILSFHGKSQKDIDYEWSWPARAIKIVSTLTHQGYTCKGQISISCLQSLDLISINEIRLGVFRADYHDEGNPHLVTWITHQQPSTSTPDFHTPTALFSYHLD